VTVIITMAGHGERFKRSGFSKPKYKITVKGKSLLEYSLISLSNFASERFIFAVLNGTDTKWITKIANKCGIEQIEFSERETVSRGQAETVFQVLDRCDKTEQLWIYNIDTYALGVPGSHIIDGFSGIIPVFETNRGDLSFVSFDESGLATEVAEKIQISRYASVGLYGFKSADIYRIAYSIYYNESNSGLQYSEMYICPIYEALIREGYPVGVYLLENHKVEILGTPEDLDLFDDTWRVCNEEK
jgi:choline kinase